jgi:hypothetical protein
MQTDLESSVATVSAASRDFDWTHDAADDARGSTDLPACSIVFLRLTQAEGGEA